MRQLTDEELIELASQDPEDGLPTNDVSYYQHMHCIVDGNTRVYTSHLYLHYYNFSSSPVSLQEFHDIIKLSKKSKSCLYLDNKLCNLDLGKLLGDYVRKKKKDKKEERLR